MTASTEASERTNSLAAGISKRTTKPTNERILLLFLRPVSSYANAGVDSAFEIKSTIHNAMLFAVPQFIRSYSRLESLVFIRSFVRLFSCIRQEIVLLTGFSFGPSSIDSMNQSRCLLRRSFGNSPNKLRIILFLIRIQLGDVHIKPPASSGARHCKSLERS